MKVVASEHKEQLSYFDLPIRSFRRLGRIILLACHGMGHALIMLASATLYIRTVWRPRARRETVSQLYLTGIKPEPKDMSALIHSRRKPLKRRYCFAGHTFCPAICR